MTSQALEQSAAPGGSAPAARPARVSAGLRRRLRHANLDLWVPGVVLAVLVGACFLLPLFGGVPDPRAGDLMATLRPVFSPGHILGTDTIGRDVFARILYGGQTSLRIGLLVNVIGMAVGGLIGMFSGFKRGVADSIVMRVLDVLMAFPALILTIVIATYLGPSEVNVIWAISFFTIPAYARLARAVTLKLREQVYISAARLSGRTDRAILLRHVAPNVLPQLLTYSLLHVGVVVVIEATMTFLGAGVSPSEPSWGSMISSGQIYLSTNPALVLVPSAVLFVTVLCLNVLGDGLRERLGGAE